jgi:hypothetical protein
MFKEKSIFLQVENPTQSLFDITFFLAMGTISINQLQQA